MNWAAYANKGLRLKIATIKKTREVTTRTMAIRKYADLKSTSSLKIARNVTKRLPACIGIITPNNITARYNSPGIQKNKIHAATVIPTYFPAPGGTLKISNKTKTEASLFYLSEVIITR